MPDVFSGLIQSTFAVGDHGNFEALVRIGDELWHYWRDNADPRFGWHAGGLVSSGTAHAGSILQSRFAAGPSGDFEVAVPLRGPNGWPELWHFHRDNADLGNDWARVQRITDAGDVVEGPASLIQSDFGVGNFELVVPLMVSSGKPALWHFWLDNAVAGPGVWARGRQITAPEETVTGPGSIIQSTLGSGGNDFEVVVPLLGSRGHPQLWHYRRDNADPASAWLKVNPVTGPDDVTAGGGAIVQSDYGDADHGNLEVVVPLRLPDGHVEVRHFWRDAEQDAVWNRGDLVTASARGGVAFTRSDFHFGDHLNFEVLLEEAGVSIVHYYRHNQDDGNPWLRSAPIVDRPRLTGEIEAHKLDPAQVRKICQLTGEYDLDGWGKLIPGDVAALAPAVASHEQHLFLAWKSFADDTLHVMSSRLAANPNTGGQLADDLGAFENRSVIPATSTNPPALVSHDGQLILAWTGLSDGRLNVAPAHLFGNTSGGLGVEDLGPVLTLDQTSSRSPALASHDGRLFLAWTGGDRRLNLMFSGDGGRSFGGHRIVDATSQHAPALASHHGQLFLAWTGVGNNRLNIAPVMLIGSTSGGFGIENVARPVTLGELSDQAPALASHRDRLFLAWKGFGNFEVNIMVSDDEGLTFAGKPPVSTVAVGTDADLPREATFASTALAAHAGLLVWAWTDASTAQLTVARYRAPDQPRRGPFGSAHNRTESQVGIRGTDLGTSFEHNGRLCFLFGDSWRVGQFDTEQLNLDAVAFAPLDADPRSGLDLTFNSGPPLIAGGGVGQQEFETPLEGISVNGTMYVFFSDQHRTVADVDLDLRSVVASSTDDGLSFTFLRQFSNLYFTSSVSLATVDGATVGLPTFGTALLIWGTARARSGDLYLAAMPLEEIADGRSVLFYTGDLGAGPTWSPDEQQAVPLFPDGGVGEHTVRWNPFLDSWMLLYIGDNPAGITLRLAPAPTGPWTRPVLVLPQFFNTKMGTFMHLPTDAHQPWHDWEFDQLVGSDRVNGAGIPYAPALIGPFTRGEPGLRSDIFFTLSTWNPYQVCLMTASLVAADLPALLTPERFETILWPHRVVKAFGTTPPDGDPQAVLGAPDGAVMVLQPQMVVEFGDYTVEAGGTYRGLAALFDPAHVTWGDTVRLEDLARIDVLAFERNGHFPPDSGGWESCNWTFSDGVHGVDVPWDGRKGAGRDQHVVAGGNVRGRDYRAVFGLDNAPLENFIGDDEIMSFLMFTVPEVDTHSPDFTVRLTGRAPGAGEDVTPDIDTIGLLPRA